MIRAIARPLLAAVFIDSGIDTLRNPDPRVQVAQPVTSAVAGKYGLPQDETMLVRINAGVQVGAGILLALGKFRRLAALALVGSTIPTTYAGHRFWEEDEPQTKAQQRVHFLKNLGLLGGLLLALVDRNKKDKKEGTSSAGGGTNGADSRVSQAGMLTNLATAAGGVAMTAAGSAGAMREAGMERRRRAAKRARKARAAQGQRAAERARWAVDAGRRSALTLADTASTAGSEHGRRAAMNANKVAEQAAERGLKAAEQGLKSAQQSLKSAQLAAARAKANAGRSR
jgi:putative oxidoreductase